MRHSDDKDTGASVNADLSSSTSESVTQRASAAEQAIKRTVVLPRREMPATNYGGHVMTSPDMQEFDVTMANYIASVSLDALAEMAKEFAEHGNLQGLQTIIDIGVLDNDGKTRGSYVPDRLVRAIYPLMFHERYESMPEFFNDWLSRCAKSNPKAVANIAYDLVAHGKITASDYPEFLAACGLDFMSPMPDDEPMIISANNKREYELYNMTLGGALVLRQRGSVCTYAMIEGPGQRGSLTDLPVMATVIHRLDSGEVVKRTLNLFDIAFLGNSPNEPEGAVERLALVLSMFDMSAPKVRKELTDALVRANDTELFDTDGSIEPLEMAALAIDAGCELEGRDDLVRGRGFQICNNVGDRLPLLSRLAAVYVKPEEVDYPPTNGQVLHAARRLITEGRTDPNALDGAKLTPLHYAVLAANPPMIEMLLESGADPSVVSPESGLDPIQTAAACGAHDIAQMLQAWSAKQAIGRVISAQSTTKPAVSKGATP